MAYQVVQEAFRENMGAQDKKNERYLATITPPLERGSGTVALL